jgi:nucleotide-binding universal stress UspA family protein|tara:strand:+ start:1272 stop:1733 length:462 start_codon:yes stop_codon:yes gene_type:complete
MKRILIAIDYHPVSEKVAEAGYKLAKQLDAKVCLLHVMANVSYYGIDYPTFMGYSGYDEMAVNLDIAQEMRGVVEDFLETAAKHLDDEKVETHLAEGDAAAAILDYSKTWNADLLVMGTHSHSVFEKLLMGTVASNVLEKTEVPVFMVPIKKD